MVVNGIAFPLLTMGQALTVFAELVRGMERGHGVTPFLSQHSMAESTRVETGR